MPKIHLTFEQFKKIYRSVEGEPEFSLYFDDRQDEYMIIKYDNRVSFQRCGTYNGSGEIYFDTLDSLFAANTMDNICLEKDWANITDIVADSKYQLSDNNDLSEFCSYYNITL